MRDNEDKTAKSNNSLLKLAELEEVNTIRLGVSAINTANNNRIQYRADERFPMGCTSIVMGVAAILKKSIKDKQYLHNKVLYQQEDLLEWSPITSRYLNHGMTIEQLCAAAITCSDNTAMNLLVKQLGGLEEINSFARSIDDEAFKLDHWWPDEAMSNTFNGTDSSTPAAMAISLQKLVLGGVLAEPQREFFKNWLIDNTTGSARIKAGLPKEWVVANKSGTGFYYGTTNDIAVIWPIQYEPLVISIFATSLEKNAKKCESIIASATRMIVTEFTEKG